MEKDVALIGQLLSLGDTIEAMKSWQLSPASSVGSLLDIDTESLCVPATSSRPVNEFLVNSNLSSPKLAKKQYFSRQNSVLRIPIPPSHRNRMKTITSMGSVDEDDTSSGASSMSRGSSATNFSRPSSFIRKEWTEPADSLSEENDENPSGPAAGKILSKGLSGVIRHESQASQDSGIHLTNSEIDREEVFV